jgi:hypothetical protein
MPLMAKKQPKKPARTGTPVNFHITDELAAALEAYIESTSPRVSKRAAWEAALSEFLKSKGFWPWPKEEA